MLMSQTIEILELVKKFIPDYEQARKIAIEILEVLDEEPGSTE